MTGGVSRRPPDYTDSNERLKNRDSCKAQTVPI